MSPTCCMCNRDGVLEVQKNWYCQGHMVDGAMEAFRLVAVWSPHVNADEVLYMIRNEVLDTTMLYYTEDYPDPDDYEEEDEEEDEDE